MSETRHFTKAEQKMALADVAASRHARDVNRRCESKHCKAWHLTTKSGMVLPKHYPDSHCILREFRTLAMLRQFRIVAPGGISMGPETYIALCTIPYYSTHHEGKANG
jgi:hypothetical protein